MFPRLVISEYGSSTNGLLQSISQFLSYISLLDAGVSAVIRAKLYKPLSQNDTKGVQLIVNAAKKFYKKIAATFLIYIVFVAIILPFTYGKYFDKLFTASLIIIIALSTFAEYFFGISYTVLLEADQRKYISYCIQIISVVLNIIASVVLIRTGVSIHIVKLVTAFLFVLRPVALSVYCNHKYHFDKTLTETCEIENKWSGLGHHIAYFLHSHTDVVLLTFVKGPLIVSVYSVYNMIVSAIRQVIFYLSGGVEAAFGNMIAKKESDSLYKGLKIYELLIYSLTTVFYTTAALSIFKFVEIYTRGVEDTNYYIPTAAIVLIIAEALYCIRRPYEAIVMAAGKLKETMNGAFAEAGINVIISIILVWKLGILGVALGTLVAMLFRTIQYANFVSKEIVDRGIGVFVKNLVVYICMALFIYYIGDFLVFKCNTYIQWALWAFCIFLIASSIVFVGDYLFFHKESTELLSMVTSLFVKKKKQN